MNIYIYRFLLFLTFPFFLYSAWKRCRKATKYSINIPNCFLSRFGLNPKKFKTGGIWIHAVSVGETRSIFPLLSRLKQHYPELPITLTSGSTQGALQALNFSPIPIQHQMIPYDYNFSIKRFLKQIKPKIVIIVETEIWPNLYNSCYELNIPLILINARLKQKSFESYKKFGGSLIANSLEKTHLIGAQFDVDAKRFIELGAKSKNIKVLGNVKFDIDISQDLGNQAQQWRQKNNSTKRFIWVAASTHHCSPKTEEELLLEVHKKLLQQQPNSLLILVPRHRDRFDEVGKILENSGLNISIKSRADKVDSQTQIYLADSMGELMLWFACCDVAFIGGSLINFGGHNILEPASLKKPIISGVFYQNLNALYQTFIKKDAIILVDNIEYFAQKLKSLSSNPTLRKKYADKAYKVFQTHAGSLDKTLSAINKAIDN